MLTDEQLESLRQDSIHERFIAGSEVRRLVMEIRDYRSRLVTSKDIESELIKLCDNYKFQIEELQKALKWYADETNYEMVETQVNAYSTETTSATWTDSGERARTALQSIQGGNTHANT